MGMDQREFGQIVRQLRHEYGNLLQVASSYLDLGMVTETRGFLHKEILKWHEEHEMLSNLPENFFVYLVFQRMQVRKLGIDLYYKKLQMASVEDLMRYNEPSVSAGALIPLTVQLPPSPAVYVSFREDADGFELCFESSSFQPLVVRYGKE